MNPFDLRGPEFLLFYICFASVVLLVLLLSRNFGGVASSAKAPMDDPYFVAFLRGGESECVRVATLALMDRGLLSIQGSGSAPSSLLSESRLVASDPQAISAVRRHIEKEILEAFQTASRISSTLEALHYCSACQDYGARLEQLGLIHTQRAREAFRYRIWVAVALLSGVALLKILIAISRGHSNFTFLILLAFLASYLATRVVSPFRTPSGERFLESFRSLFDSLRRRASMLRPGGASTDLVWLASIFGLSAVPGLAFPHASALIIRPVPAAGSESSGFFSNTNSSGTFSSCGGGCGSGCGGGCGGCGS